MKIDYRSFIGNKAKLPKPKVVTDDKLKLTAVCTSWGDQANANDFFINTVIDYYGSASADEGATKPYPNIPTLSNNENNLRVAVILAAQKIYSEFNTEEYMCGVESFVMISSKQELIWFATKGFNTVVFNNHGVFPMQLNIPLSVQLNNKAKSTPLPLELLGINQSEHILPNSIKKTSSDKFVLILRNHFNPKLMNFKSSEVSIKTISKILSQDIDEPYWLGVIEV